MSIINFSEVSNNIDLLFVLTIPYKFLILSDISFWGGKMKKNIFQTLGLAILLIYCSDAPNDIEDATFKLGDTLTIAYGETQFNSSQDLSINFDTILEDSRCPVDVVCVWEGNAEIKFILSSNDSFVDFTLNTAGSYFNTDTTLYGYEIELIDLLPYPHSQIQHPITDYKAVVLISD